MEGGEGQVREGECGAAGTGENRLTGEKAGKVDLSRRLIRTHGTLILGGPYMGT